MLFAIPSASFGCINAMLHQTFLFLGQLWQLFEVSQILEFLRYFEIKEVFIYCISLIVWFLLHTYRVLRNQNNLDFGVCLNNFYEISLHPVDIIG